jgi:hypothetical protein
MIANGVRVLIPGYALASVFTAMAGITTITRYTILKEAPFLNLAPAAYLRLWVTNEQFQPLLALEFKGS